MNTNVQLYNNTISTDMCPLWPEVPALNTMAVPLTAFESKSITETIYDNLPKTWNDAFPHFANGILMSEAFKYNPINRISFLATKILPSSENNSQNATAYTKSAQQLCRYGAYNLELQRQYSWLLPCTLAGDIPSCTKYIMYGLGSQVLKHIEKGKMPTPPTAVNFIFRQVLYAKIVDTTISCVTKSWGECIIDGLQVLGGNAWIYYTESEDT